MDRITKGQFVEYLVQLKNMPGLTEKQLRDLDRQIKQLRGELSQDLQFNLPTGINLPGLYEVRRLNQSVGAQGQGIGYQDNRVIEINLNINNGMDEQAAKQMLGDALGVGSRFGNAPRRF